MLGRSEVVAQLAASQEGLSSMKLVSCVSMKCKAALSLVTTKNLIKIINLFHFVFIRVQSLCCAINYYDKMLTNCNKSIIMNSHAAEPFFRTRKSFSYSRISKHFMETTGPSPEPD
jgi:hypothetical protein